MKSMYVQWLWWENWIWNEHGPCLLLGWQPLHWWDVGLELIGPEPEPGVSKGFPVPNGFHHLIRGRCVAWGAGIRALTKWISPVCDGNFWIILSHDQGIRAWGCTSQLVLCAKGFLGGSVVKKKKRKLSTRGRRPRFDSWVRKVLWSRKWQPAPVLLPGKSHE